jgi:hypothetical protein
MLSKVWLVHYFVLTYGFLSLLFFTQSSRGCCKRAGLLIERYMRIKLQLENGSNVMQNGRQIYILSSCRKKVVA